MARIPAIPRTPPRRREVIAGLTRALLLMLAVAAGCGRGSAPSETPATPPTPAGAAWFQEVAADRGLDFAWDSGAAADKRSTGRLYLPAITGGGAALLDMDGDGDLDVYCVQAGGGITGASEQREPNRLFENQGDGMFRDVTEGSGTGDRGYGMGAACGDIDGDGDVDLYVTNVGANVLLRNDGGGRFTDITAESGVGDTGWGSSATFVDYDRDGDLDLFALNYLNWSPQTEIDCYSNAGTPDYCLPANYAAPARDVLYRNEGNGTFTDVTEAAGMIGAVGTGLGVVCGDFNGDGWPDMFVANDGMPDHLWFNRRNGSFIEFANTVGAALDQEGKAKAGMGVTAADIDDDGDLDLMVCNLRNEADSVFLNQGQYFTDATITTGVSAATRRYTRFGMGWRDFDNDGYLDLFQANGRVQILADTYAEDVYAEPNTLLRGRTGPRFESVEPVGGTAAKLVHTSRAAAFGDLDDDGGIDIVVVNRDAPAYLLRNVTPDRGHWLTLRVLDSRGSDAIGASVELQLGSRTVRRDVRAAYSFLASNDPRVHFGLGQVDTVSSVTVLWPDGTRERFDGLQVDHVNELRRGRGTPVTPPG